MRWNSAPVIIALTASLLAPNRTGSAEEKRISVYSTIASYTLPVLDRQGREYVGLLEILEPLGRVTSRSDGRRWRFRFNNIDADFTADKTRGRIAGKDVELAAPFVLDNGRGLVPLASLATLLPRFLGGPVTLHESAGRLFVGNVFTQFTVDLVKTTPARLVFNFSSPVNPTISTEPGHLRMVFARDPLISKSTQEWKFEDRQISSVSYAENNGAAEITINTAVPLMASFSAGGRTITITSPPVTAAPAPPAGTSATNPAVPSNSLGTPSAPPTSGTPANRFLVVVDASHGGAERGAALTDQLAEKDVSLAFARLLRHELEVRGASVLMTRDADIMVGLDQRAATANARHTSLYLNVHAASQGTGVRLYSVILPPGAGNRGTWIDWDTAQASVLSMSQQLASGSAAEFQKRRIPVRVLATSLRPLNNVAAPAIAIELAPPSNNVPDVNSPSYQQPIAATMAEFVVAQKPRLEAGR